MSNSTNKRQKIILISSPFIAITISVVTTLYFTGHLNMGFMQHKSNYKNVTFTDATLTCKEATRSKFSENLQSVMIDNHSSRYEHNHFLYKIFLQADTTEKANETTLYYINCYVKASNGSIDTFDVFEDKDTAESGLGTEPGNFFNWPR